MNIKEIIQQKEELLQILQTLKEKLENKEFEEEWENLRLQYTFRKNQLENYE